MQTIPTLPNVTRLKARTSQCSYYAPTEFLVSDFRMQLSATEYGNFLANEPLPISTTTISEKATQILVDQFNYLRNNSVYPLDRFLEYMT